MNVPIQDILLCFFWGGVLLACVHSALIFSTRFLLASEVTLFMLLEFSLGPFWVWIFLNELIKSDVFPNVSKDKENFYLKKLINGAARLMHGNGIRSI